MGMWGFGLYQNDMVLDIQGEFEEMFKNGKSPQEITDVLMEEYSGTIGMLKRNLYFGMRWQILNGTLACSCRKLRRGRYIG